MLAETVDVTTRRQTFFRYVFGDNVEGFIGLSKLNPVSQEWREAYFAWPSEEDKLYAWITEAAPGHNIYYCPQVLSAPKRNAESVETCTCAWADLDTCSPKNLLIAPTITIETSPGRYQALWVFTDPIDPADAEDISRRIAYYHADDGCDRSGWDLSQVLRIPLSTNFKYGSHEHPTVKVIATNNAPLTKEAFSIYPLAKGYQYAEIPMPTDEVLEALDAPSILERYRMRLLPAVTKLFQTEPKGSWSEPLWNLQLLLFEGGLTREEVFVVADASACNKYRRRKQAPIFLWKEVCRAFQTFEERHKLVTSSTKYDIPLLTDEEREWAEAHPTIVEEYIEWAKSVGDAAWQYHQAGGFVILSSLLAGNVRLPASFGTVVPNLWFMILADTTVTRKTTAMDLAMDLITEVDPDAVLATDGTIEGLFTSLAMRPGRPSIFLRDEFSGLLDAMNRKDYYAGMAETLTKLYDGKYLKRILKKETVEIKQPCLIFFAGGIKERTLNLLTYEDVASGFLPRFVFITAEADLTKLRPLGPPTTTSLAGRDRLARKFQRLSDHYKQLQQINVNGKLISAPRVWDVKLTDAAWLRFNELNDKMLEAAYHAFHRDLITASFTRLAISGLKAAILIAATRRLTDEVVVDVPDLITAFRYVEVWRDYALDVLNNIGRTTQERTLEQVRKAIYSRPSILRSELMQNHHLNARDTDLILTTLDQRGLITRAKSGRSERLYPIGPAPSHPVVSR